MMSLHSDVLPDPSTSLLFLSQRLKEMQEGWSELRKVWSERCQVLSADPRTAGILYSQTHDFPWGAVCALGLKPGLQAIADLPHSQLPSELTKRNLPYFIVFIEFTHWRLSAQNNPWNFASLKTINYILWNWWFSVLFLPWFLKFLRHILTYFYYPVHQHRFWSAVN